MTPAARVQASIEILDRYLQGEAVEKALTSWARSNRFAGSKDRAAIRDHVFHAIRKRASLGAWPTGSGRVWMAATVEDSGLSVDDLFNGVGYGPQSLDDAEWDIVKARPKDHPDVQDWVRDQMRSDHGSDALKIFAALTRRGPITLRTNSAKGDRKQIGQQLAAEGIETRTNPVSPTALTVTNGERRVTQSSAFQSGLVELQDAASQAVCGLFDAKGAVLDYCAGGGGKALAMAAAGATVTAHDANVNRMRDIPQRAKRAGVSINCASNMAALATEYDGVFCDVPCSGSGAWRRTPDHKWRFSEKDLADLVILQRKIIRGALKHLRPGGRFGYATCSVFSAENGEQAQWISDQFKTLQLIEQKQFLPCEDCDGLFVAIFQSNSLD